METAETRPVTKTPDYSNIDPRLLSKFLKIQEFRQGLSPEAYQSAQFRLATRKWTQDERIVYLAVQEGYTDTSSLPMATGLTDADIRKALDLLVKRGALRLTTEVVH